MRCAHELGFLLQIRDASWAVFKALPVVTSLGVTALNGLTAVYARGLTHEIEGLRGNFCLYANETSGKPVYYKEYVSEATGNPLGPPAIQRFPQAIHETSWFQKAVSFPINNISWTIGRSLISKLCWLANLLWIDSSFEAIRCVYIILKLVEAFLFRVVFEIFSISSLLILNRRRMSWLNSILAWHYLHILF